MIKNNNTLTEYCKTLPFLSEHDKLHQGSRRSLGATVQTKGKRNKIKHWNVQYHFGKTSIPLLPRTRLTHTIEMINYYRRLSDTSNISSLERRHHENTLPLTPSAGKSWSSEANKRRGSGWFSICGGVMGGRGSHGCENSWWYHLFIYTGEERREAPGGGGAGGGGDL